MSSTALHADFRITFEGKQYTAQGFIALQETASWVVDVQAAVRFWLSPKGDLKVKTSGSTGAPKTILLTKKTLMASAEATISFFNLNHKSSVLLFIPAKFIGGKMVVFRAMMAGMNLTIIEPKTALPILGSSFDFVSLTPLQAAGSLAQLLRFKAILLGGGAVHSSLEDKLKTIDAQVYHGYGMTETASHVALKKLNGHDQQDCFEAQPGVQFSLDDRNCLVIYASAWGISELVTNDVVKLHSETRFTWLGRADNVVNSGGVKLYPEEIERLLAPAINEPFFVSGLLDAEFGQKLVLLVESETEFPIDFSHLSGYQKPRDVFFLPRFVYTDTGKVNRVETVNLL